MIIYSSISLKIFFENIKDVAILKSIHESANDLVTDITNIQILFAKYEGSV